LHHVIKGGGPLGAVTGDVVVGAGGRVHGLHGADGEDQRIVAGGGDGSVAVAAVDAEAAEVASGHDDRDAGVPSLLNRLAERIVCVVGIDRPAERQIDHANVVCALESDGFLNGGDDLAVGSDSVPVENPKVDEVYAVGDAGHGRALTAGIGAVAGHNASDVGAVPVGIPNLHAAGIGGRAGEVLVIDHAGLPIRVAQIVVVIVDPAVDDGDADAQARAAEAGAARGAQIDGSAGQVVGAVELVVGNDEGYLVIVGESIEGRHGQSEGTAFH